MRRLTERERAAAAEALEQVLQLVDDRNIEAKPSERAVIRGALEGLRA